MTYLNLARYLDQFRGKFPVFSDDIQGASSRALRHSYASHLSTCAALPQPGKRLLNQYRQPYDCYTVTLILCMGPQRSEEPS